MTRPLASRVVNRLHRERVQRRYRRRTLAGSGAAGVVLQPLLKDIELPPAPAALPWTAARYAAGWFDLLGSGWRPFTSTTAPEIDWHTDLLSGHRWDPALWHRDIDRTPGPGVDVKLPWELGRLQHLPQLALAYRYAAAGTPGFAAAEDYRAALEDHLVDFIDKNSAGRGVQWGCTMDVGIRVANVLLAIDLLATAGASLTDAAQRLVTQSVYDHAAFIVANLEWTRALRTNHYLADVCGLVWAAAHMEGRKELDSWLCFAARELQVETGHQFDRDGAGKEGSTAYHRLSAEMVVWTTALLLSLPEERVQSLRPGIGDLDDVPLPIRHPAPVPDDVLPGHNHLRIVNRMADLTTAITRAGGVALIGDNDSGRFVKPAPAYVAMTVREAVDRYANLEGYHRLPATETYWWEDSTNHRHLPAAIDGLFGAPGADLDGAIVHAYARHPPARPPRASTLHVGIGSARPRIEGDEATHTTLVVPGGDDLVDGISSQAFVTFGLYVWRSDRLFLTVRCGPVGQAGFGGHDHRDQLAVELWIDGVPWFRDPGTATYTRNPDVRNAYRSTACHAGPPDGATEDWTAVPGLFELGALADAGVPLWYRTDGFVGQRQSTAGVAKRSVELLPDRVRIVDTVIDGPTAPTTLRSAGDAASLPTFPVSYSPGYGWQERKVQGGERRTTPEASPQAGRAP